MQTILEEVRAKALELWTREGLLDESVTVLAGPLSVKEAIGTPDASDFPIQKGKEKLMEASFRGARGQAFTDHFGNWSGTLGEVSRIPMTDNFNRAVFVATLNAVMRHLELADHTIHCKNEEPGQCAQGVAAHIRDRFGHSRVTIIGFQPALAEAMNTVTDVRLIDLDPDNIGKVKRGVLVEGGEATENAVNWCDVLLVTGTTLANDSIRLFLTDKPVIFYGTTIAGGAALMGWDRYCPKSA